MTECEKIVDTIAREGILRDIINTVTQNGKAAKDLMSISDLEQDIYISLLNKGDKLVDIWNEGHIKFFLARIVTNNIKSSTSPYYMKYLLPAKRNVEFDDRLLTIPDE